MDAAQALAAALPPPGQAALFLDFDGTLVDLADTPDGIRVPHDLGALLSDLAQVTGGALALVSGRRLSDLAHFLPNYTGHAIGGHGAEWRLDGQRRAHPLAGSEVLASLTRMVQALAAQDARLICEPKPTGVVLHYRQAPELGLPLDARMQAFAHLHPGFELHRAKMALELRPDDIGKDHAVASLMRRSEFAQRTGIFFGDDATDEPAMRYVIEQGGTACKVGEGESGAPLRAPSPDIVRAALRRWMCGGDKECPTG